MTLNIEVVIEDGNHTIVITEDGEEISRYPYQYNSIECTVDYDNVVNNVLEEVRQTLEVDFR